MAAFLLQTPENERIGFLLLAGSESLSTGGNPRDCVFMSAPGQGELVEHAINVFLTEYKTTEFRCFLSLNDEIQEANISINQDIQVQLCWAQNGSGTWRVRHARENELWGTCQLLPTGFLKS